MKSLLVIEKLGVFFRAYFGDWRIVRLKAFSWEKQKDGCYEREICHVGNEHVLVYAKTEISETTYRRYEKEIGHLEDQSLGDHFLYRQRNAYRDPFTIFQTPGGYWGRESCIWIETHPFKIVEYFTPLGLACIQQAYAHS